MDVAAGIFAAARVGLDGALTCSSQVAEMEVPFASKNTTPISPVFRGVPVRDGSDARIPIVCGECPNEERVWRNRNRPNSCLS